MRVHRSRARPVDREDVQPVRPTATPAVFPAPIRGKVTNINVASQPETTAQIVRNLWPTNRGLEPRGGSQFLNTTVGATLRMFAHTDGSEKWLFAATRERIYEVDPDTNTRSVVMSGRTSGDYSENAIVTDDLTFLLMVNGADDAAVFNGTDWSTVNGTSTPYAITGVDTSDLSHVWNYRNRQFFIKKGSMDAYYMDVNNAFGAATRLPLGGVFNKGGSLLSGATWSSDSGEGADDQCVFITDQGEVAVFQGADPGNINSWNLRGVFDIGAPLGKNMHFSVGGDLLIATKSGLIPLSAAIQKTPDQLGLDALSYDIEPDWLKAVAGAGNTPGWTLVNWQSQNMLLIAAPQTAGVSQNILVVNTQTRAWADITGWDMSAGAVFDDKFYFANITSTGNGKLFQGNAGGQDDGQPFTCQLSYAFSDLGSPGAIKQCNLMRAWFKYRTPFKVEVSAATDYRTLFPTATPEDMPENVGVAWDLATWDVSSWDGGTDVDQVKHAWNAVFAHGVAIAPQFQIISDSTEKINAEFIRLEVIYETGGVLV